MKRNAFVIMLAAGIVFLLPAQQRLRPTDIQKLGVVDMDRVYKVFPGDSRAMQELNDRQAKIQEDLNKFNEDINQLKINLAAAKETGDESQAKKIDAELARKTKSAQDYWEKGKTELENKRAAVSRTGMNEKIGQAVDAIMKDNGFTIILPKSATLGFTSSVDITNMLISKLQDK